MADFCKQCSIEIFGEDNGDLKDLSKDPVALCTVICEGCGVVQVNKQGECVSTDCLKKHGQNRA